MNPCASCGSEIGPDTGPCPECGTETQSKPPPPLPPKIPKTLDGRMATLILLAFFVAQTVCGVIGAIAGAILLISRNGVESLEQFDLMLSPIVAPMALCSVIGGTIALMLLARRIFGTTLSNVGATDAAWVVGRMKNILLGLGAGIFTGCLYFAFSFFVTQPDVSSLGPLAKMATTPGLQQLTWFTIALIFAPISEELLFRGIVYGGFRRSLGPVAAAILTTSIFWLLHITEMIHYWPSMIAIALFATIALWCRLRFAAIGPAVAVHVGFNGTLAVILLVYG